MEPRREKASPSDYPDAAFVGMDHVESHTTRLLGTVAASVMKSTAVRFRRGDVLYGRLRPYLNKVALPDFDGLASGEFIVLPETECVSSSFLKHRLSAADFVSFASHLNEGDRPRVNFEQIGQFMILIPPPREQSRIVAKIEELFSKLDAGIEVLKTARSQLATYRQAVLKHAFEGKLTGQWRAANRDQLEPPEGLLGRIRRARVKRHDEQIRRWKNAVNDWKDGARDACRPTRPAPLRAISAVPESETGNSPTLPAGWTYVRLGLLIDEPKYGTSRKCGYDYQGTGVLRIPNVVDGVINVDDLKGAHFNDDDVAAFSLVKGDILMIRSNGSISIVGKTAIVSESEEEYLYAGYLMRLRGNIDVIVPDYLVLTLGSHYVRIQIEKTAKSTSGVNNINAREVQSIVIPVCSVNEQRLVIDEVRKELSTIDALVRRIEIQLSMAETLRQSILKKAFSGELVPQDQSDEPASVLLDRIRIEREQAAKRKTRPNTGKRRPSV